jgi:hypothetical protein
MDESEDPRKQMGRKRRPLAGGPAKKNIGPAAALDGFAEGVSGLVNLR